jgi:hypothetical protein
MRAGGHAAIAAGIGVLAASAAVSAAKPVPHKPTAKAKLACEARVRGAALASTQVVVFHRYSGTSPSGERATTYLACLRPRGAGVALGYSWPDDGYYGSDATLARFRASGTYVAAEGSSGEASSTVCSKYQQSSCPTPHYWISVVDARSRRHADISVPGYGNASAVVLSPAGAVAWLESTGTSGYTLKATTLRPRGRSGFATAPQQIDAGQIARRSVRFAGLTLSWVRDGVAHSQTLS